VMEIEALGQDTIFKFTIEFFLRERKK